MLEIGSVFDERYQILSKLGHGGMGMVFKARHLEGDRLVALKVIHASLVGDEENEARFLREAQVLYKLSHPNIPVFYHLGKAEDNLYIAMELLDGVLLRKLISDNGLGVERAIKIGIQICSALEAAHQQNIVHRDLKPENIFLQEHPHPEFVKVLDFGLARIIPETGNTIQKLTQTGLLIGSVAYMSPEQCMGRKATPASDIYSLACLLYEASTGNQLFHADNPVGLLHKQINEKPEFGALCKQQSGYQLMEVLEVALEKDSAKRFPDAQSFKASLELALISKPALQGRFQAVKGRFRIVPVFVLLAATVFSSLVYFFLNSKEGAPKKESTSTLMDDRMAFKTLHKIAGDRGADITPLAIDLLQRSARKQMSLIDLRTMLNDIQGNIPADPQILNQLLLFIKEFSDSPLNHEYLVLAEASIYEALLYEKLGNANKQMDCVQKALDYLKKERRLPTEEAQQKAFRVLGRLYLQKKDFKTAVTIFAAAKQLGRNDYVSMELFESYTKNGQIKRGRLSYDDTSSELRGQVSYNDCIRRWAWKFYEDKEYKNVVVMVRPAIDYVKDPIPRANLVTCLCLAYKYLGRRELALQQYHFLQEMQAHREGLNSEEKTEIARLLIMIKNDGLI